MAQEIRRKSVTIPPNTPIAAGFTADLSFPVRVVREIEVVIPPGPLGTVGFALGSAGVPVIPVEAGGYIVSDDEVIRWPLEGLWDSGAWTLFGYNTGRYAHTIEVRFLVDLVAQPDRLSTPIPAHRLASTAAVAPSWGA